MSATPDDKTPGQPVDHEDIMSFADGVLPPERRSDVRDALAQDESLMQSLESFLFTRGPLVRAFDDVLSAPIPERLLRAVRESEPARTSSVTSLLGWLGLAGLVEALRLPAFSPAFAIPGALVAAVAGWLLHGSLGTVVAPVGHGPLDSAALQQALEVTPTGGSAGVANGIALTPRFTFATPQKMWCRQYALTYSDGLEAGGVACRKPDGVWQVLMETRAAATRAPGSNTVRPAGEQPGGNAPLDSQTVLDGVRAHMRQGDVLGPEEEAPLIKGHWPIQP